MKALHVAATGMMAQQTNIEVTSNNIANMTTTAFKRQRAEFQDLLYETHNRTGSTTSDVGTVVPTGIQLGLGVKAGATYRINEQGTLTRTSNNLDLALNGAGNFVVTLPNGDFGYTRAGSFQLSPDGDIVTSEGYIVSPAINIPVDAVDVVINQFGEVQVKLDGEQAYQNVGQFEIATFVNQAGLEAIGDNLFLETEASGPAIVGIAAEEGVGEMMQGYLENSNVDPVTEITNLIQAQRSYELNSKVISAADEMLQTVNQARR